MSLGIVIFIFLILSFGALFYFLYKSFKQISDELKRLAKVQELSHNQVINAEKIMRLMNEKLSL